MTDEKIKTLPEVIREFTKQKGNSEMKIAQDSEGLIKQPSVNDLKNGRVDPRNATVQNLYGLAKGMKKRPFEIFCLALQITAEDFGINDGTEELQEFEHIFHLLPDNRKMDILGIMKHFLSEATNQKTSLYVDSQVELEGISTDDLQMGEKFNPEGFSQDELIFNDSKTKKKKLVS